MSEVSGAVHRSYKRYNDALAAFQAALDAGFVVNLPDVHGVLNRNGGNVRSFSFDLIYLADLRAFSE